MCFEIEKLLWDCLKIFQIYFRSEIVLLYFFTTLS